MFNNNTIQLSYSRPFFSSSLRFGIPTPYVFKIPDMDKYRIGSYCHVSRPSYMRVIKQSRRMGKNRGATATTHEKHLLFTCSSNLLFCILNQTQQLVSNPHNIYLLFILFFLFFFHISFGLSLFFSLCSVVYSFFFTIGLTVLLLTEKF